MGKLTLQFWLLKSCIAKEWRYHLQISALICCLLLLLVTLGLFSGWMTEVGNSSQDLAVTTTLCIISLLSMSIALMLYMSRIISRNVKSTIGELCSFKVMGISEKEILIVVAIESVVTSAFGVLLAVAIHKILEWHIAIVSWSWVVTLLEVSFTNTGWFGVGSIATIILILSVVILAWRASRFKKVGVIG